MLDSLLRNVGDILHPSLTKTSNCSYLASNFFWWDNFFSNSINITFTLCISQSLLFKTFSFVFYNFFTCQLNSCLWTCLSLIQSSIFCHLPSYFLVSFFVLFRMLWMLVTVNELEHTTYHVSRAPQMLSC